MPNVNSTEPVKNFSSQRYIDFTRDFCYKLCEVAAIVDGARALATEIDDGENAFVAISLDAVKEKLLALSTELDGTSYIYEVK